MIIRRTLDELTAYLESSRDQLTWREPVISVIATGHYQVSGNTKPWYEVFAGRTERNEFYIACGCMAGLNGKPCYHALAAYTLHVQIKLGEQKQNGRY